MYSIFLILNKFFFYKIFGFPILILWLFFCSVYISIKLFFPAERLIKYGVIKAFKNQYSPNDKGVVSPKKALFTSISGTVGMGTIVGTCMAVKIGGPGTIVWMIISLIFSINLIFVESFLSHKYRRIRDKNNIMGGPFIYLRTGLESIGYKKTAITLSFLYLFMFLFSAFGMGIFQVNQVTNLVIDYKFFSNYKIIISLFFSLIVSYSLFKDSKVIVGLIGKLVPLMTLIYFLSLLTIILINYKNIPNAFQIIFKDAFGFKQISSGLITTIAIGIQRAIFSNESGLGSSSIPHSLAKTKDSILEASIASIAPIINTIFFCVFTALSIILTDVYKQDINGVLIAKYTFSTVSVYFPFFLTLSSVIFVISNVITFSFYGKLVFSIITKHKYIFIYNIIYIFFIFISFNINIDTLMIIIDTLFLSLSIPNLVGILLMSNLVKKKLNLYYRNILNRNYFNEKIFSTNRK